MVNVFVCVLTTILLLQASKWLVSGIISLSATSSRKYRILARETGSVADQVTWVSPLISGVHACG